MAPIRRYLRITRYSVLEVRIYLENPALANSWLLNPRAPVLPKVIESVRPLVLPKLREERERARKKGNKKRAIKDIVVEDDFEVAIFLTETDTRHSILYKHKHARDKTQTRLRSNSKKLTGSGEGFSRNAAVDLSDDGDEDEATAAGLELIQAAGGDEIPILRRENNEEGEEAQVSLYNIPEAPSSGNAQKVAGSGSGARGTKRRRQSSRHGETALHRGYNGDHELQEVDGADGDYVVVDSEDDEDNAEENEAVRPPRRRQRTRTIDESNGDQHAPEGAVDGGEKKKVAMDISYEGFALYGRVLCLVVKRRANMATGTRAIVAGTAAASSCGSGSRTQAASSRTATGGGGGGQARMENWIASTQMMPVAEQVDEG